RPRRAGDAPRIDAPVAVEAAVLDGQEGVDDVRRQLLYLDRRIDNGAVSRDRRAVGGEQSELRRHHRLQRLRQRGGDRQPREQQQEQQQQGEQAALDPPAAGSPRPYGRRRGFGLRPQPKLVVQPGTELGITRAFFVVEWGVRHVFPVATRARLLPAFR